jgi:glycosyltransferase involved in cell wall biosynthesis
LKILQVNKYYYPKSGSERYLFDVSEMLQNHGHKVIPFAMKHKKNVETVYSEYFVENIDYETVIKKSVFNKMFAFFKIIYSFEAEKKIKSLIAREKPDIAHVHKFSNTLTPSVLYGIKKLRIPMVQTLHDYRTICPNYNLYDFGRFELCEDCKGHHYFNAIKRRCQKSSMLIGLNVALESYLYHFMKTYENTIDLFISPSNFLREKMVEFGVDKKKIIYIPNFINCNNHSPNYFNFDYIIYFGRLENHKGVKTLIKAMEDVKQFKLYVIGSGNYRIELDKIVKKANIKNVEFFGFLKREQLINLIRNSLFTVIPSEWYENCPMTILESFALGKPVIGANIGGIPQLVDHGSTGLLFETGNVKDLTEKINYLLENEQQAVNMGKNARKKVEENYNEEIHYKKLINAYEKVI